MMSLNRQNANFSGVSDNSFSWGDRNKPHLNIIVWYSLITISHSVSLRRLSRCLPLRYSTGHLMMNLCDTELMRRNKFMSSGTCHIIATEGVRLIKFALVSWAFHSGIAAAPFPPLPVPDFFFVGGGGVCTLAGRDRTSFHNFFTHHFEHQMEKNKVSLVYFSLILHSGEQCSMKLFTRAVASILINDSRLPVMLN